MVHLSLKKNNQSFAAYCNHKEKPRFDQTAHRICSLIPPEKAAEITKFVLQTFMTANWD